jgi:large subunit ribosomal protein L15
MKLSELPKIAACAKNTKRRGRGVGSGQGKTAGRGHKGGKARAGYSPAPCCSGIPFYRHLPIRGFSNGKFKKKCFTVSLQRLVDLRVDVVDKACMQKLGLIKGSDEVIKILGGATVICPITVIADRFSKSAVEEITGAGGRAVPLIDLRVGG